VAKTNGEDDKTWPLEPKGRRQPGQRSRNCCIDHIGDSADDAYVTLSGRAGARTVKEPRILVLDDEPANTRLLRHLLESWGYLDVRTLNNPGELPHIVERVKPDLLLLDLNMPHRSGYEVLCDLSRGLGGATPLPVLVLTADTDPKAAHAALSLGAGDFVTKPFDHDEVPLRVGNLLEIRDLQLQAQTQCDLLEDHVRQRTTQLELARFDLLRRLAIAGEYRDDQTDRHARRIAHTAGLLAQCLGLPADEVHRITHAAPLHDIGKIAIPDATLLKPGPLTPVEYETIKIHPIVGARILGGTGSQLLRVAAEIAASGGTAAATPTAWPPTPFP
jgi:putative two-component system response regulator